MQVGGISRPKEHAQPLTFRAKTDASKSKGKPDASKYKPVSFACHECTISDDTNLAQGSAITIAS
jgi:hypothetical protein